MLIKVKGKRNHSYEQIISCKTLLSYLSCIGNFVSQPLLIFVFFYIWCYPSLFYIYTLKRILEGLMVTPYYTDSLCLQVRYSAQQFSNVANCKAPFFTIVAGEFCVFIKTYQALRVVCSLSVMVFFVHFLFFIFCDVCSWFQFFQSLARCPSVYCSCCTWAFARIACSAPLDFVLDMTIGADDSLRYDVSIAVITSSFHPH